MLKKNHREKIIKDYNTKTGCAQINHEDMENTVLNQRVKFPD